MTHSLSQRTASSRQPTRRKLSSFVTDSQIKATEDTHLTNAIVAKDMMRAAASTHCALDERPGGGVAVLHARPLL
jgi:hypothetical protein